MAENKFNELPIRAKKEMAQDIAQIIGFLHSGHAKEAASLLEALKIRSIKLPEQIQQDVLIFAEQVQFQFAYDPWHRITKNVQIAADNLLEDLGLLNPPLRSAS